jgi:Integrase core domain
VQTAEGKLYLFVAIDRTSKFAFVQLVEKATRVTASAFLTALVAAVPYKIHTVLTDNGIQFRFQPRYADGPTATFMTHMFDMRCRENGIEHRFTKINHPWTNGQVERMNRTIKEATVQRYHYDSHQQLSHHLDDFVRAYNFGRRLKTLKGFTPYEFICKSWTSQPERFTLNPLQQMPGLNILARLTWGGPSSSAIYVVNAPSSLLRIRGQSPFSTCGTMTASTHIRSGTAARTLIPHSRGHRAQEGWDQSFCDGVLRPRRATIATRLDPTGLPLWLSRGWDDLPSVCLSLMP